MDGYNGKLVPDNIMNMIFPENNDLEEESLVVSKCKKISNWGIGQDRALILSTHYIYLLSSKEIKKKVSIHEAKYLIKSLAKNCKEIIVYFREGFDFRLSLDNSEELFSMMKLRFAVLNPKTTLKVYGVPESSLKNYVAPTKKNSYAFECDPDDKFRLTDEEIPGSQDTAAHKSMKATFTKKEVPLEQDPNEFEFSNRDNILQEQEQKTGDEQLEFDDDDLRDSE
jgi:hypothetical protein